MKTEYRKSSGEPLGEREWSANLQQDRCCDVEPYAICHWRKAEKAYTALKQSQKTCLQDRVLLSSVSKKDMFRRASATSQLLRDISAKLQIYPVFMSASSCANPPAQLLLRAAIVNEAGCARAMRSRLNLIDERKAAKKWNIPENGK